MTATSGMNIAQRILHVGGRSNAAGYVEFGSIQAVEALVRQVLRDLPAPQSQQPAVESTLPDITSPVVNDMCWKILEELPQSLSGANFNALKPALYEALKLYTAPQAQRSAVKPVAYGRWHEDGGYIDMVFLDKEECSQYLDDDEEPVALFASPQPPADVPLLTDDEREEIIAAKSGYGRTNLNAIIRATEQAVRKKAGVK